MSGPTHPADPAEPALPSRRTLLLAAAGGLVAGCGGDPSTPEGNLPLLPRRPVVPVNGPPWAGFAGNAQHSALGQVATLPMRGFFWYTPVDQNPQYANGALQTHYGSPLITRRNTVLVPVKIGASFNFRVYGRVGATGDLVWQLFSDYVAPPTRWIPSFNPGAHARQPHGDAVDRRARADSRRRRCRNLVDRQHRVLRQRGLRSRFQAPSTARCSSTRRSPATVPATSSSVSWC